MANKNEDVFQLYDLRVDVEQAPGMEMGCNHPKGSYFLVRGENLIFPESDGFPFYALSSLMPLLAAKQRQTHPNDWMSTDHVVACPDPLCGGRFRITRTGITTFKHSEVTLNTLEAE
jgi:uncharacterized repeat protein (TIGR04076 family)